MSLASRAASESPTAAHARDPDGVDTLHPDAPGSAFRLGAGDPNRISGFLIERGTPATPIEGFAQAWQVRAHALRYSSGPMGYTARLHIRTAARQRYSWRDTPGWLATPRDFRNQEFTAYVRVHGITDARRAAIAIKIRGGEHSAKRPDNASCTMMTFQGPQSGAVARFGKELTHPAYDYVTLAPHFDAALVEQRWFGLKLVSYVVPGEPRRVVNRLHVDTMPFDASGTPRNDWPLLAEYVDEAGKRTGRYDTLVDWGGWQTTLRADGVSALDFARISLREIVPPPA